MTHIKGLPVHVGTVAGMRDHDRFQEERQRIREQLARVVEAGRTGEWAQYRSRLRDLREVLLRHIADENAVLLPRVGSRGRFLQAEHARFRQQVEMLGVAAPEADPDGCLRELDDLARALVRHHAEEDALDASAADKLPDGPPALDLRGLAPPEPIARILKALERDPRGVLRVILPHEPVPLYDVLRKRGYACRGAPREAGGFELVIEPS